MGAVALYDHLFSKLQLLFRGAQSNGEGIGMAVTVTCWNQAQVDAVVKEIGGWKPFCDLIEQRKLFFSITSESESNNRRLSEYVHDHMLQVNSKARVAAFKPITDDGGNQESNSPA